MARRFALLLLLMPYAAQGEGKVTISAVRGNLSVIDGATDRIGVSAGADGILMVDSGYMENAKEVKAAIGSLGRGNATTLINTHWHHSFGNAAFSDTRIIAHANVAKRMKKPNLMFNRLVPAAPREGLPDETFDSTHSLTFNGEQIDIVSLTPSHTDSDAVVIFRTSNVVFTGDLFVPHLPWIDHASGGTVAGLLAAIDRLVAIVPKDAILVPGHGPTSSYADLLEYRQAVRQVATLVGERIQRGASLAAVQEQGLPASLQTWLKNGLPAELVIESFFKGLTHSGAGTNCEYVNGRWFNGQAFVEDAGFWSEGGVLTRKRPKLVDCAVDLGDRYIIPPFAEAHTHKFGTVESHSRDGPALVRSGIFYAMVQDATHIVTPELRVLAGDRSGLEVTYTHGVVTPSWGVIPQFYRLMADRGMLGSGVTFESASDRLFFTVDTAADLERKWPQIAASNRDFVKVILAFSDEMERRRDNPRFDARPPDYSKRPGFDPALLPALITKAHASGLRVSAHIETAADFRAAVAAGVDIIAHLPGAWQIGPATGIDGEGLRPWLLTVADAEQAKARGVKVITTTYRDPNDPRLADHRAAHAHNIKLLFDAGAELMLGSDSFAASVIDEYLFIDSLSVVDRAKLLDIATRQTARGIFPARRIGELKEGYEASFLAYDSNPLTLGSGLKSPALRVKAGKLIE